MQLKRGIQGTYLPLKSATAFSASSLFTKKIAAVFFWGYVLTNLISDPSSKA